ncbi:MAG: hypothetical protein ACLQVL_24615 [Terriglobia bacterium]
MDERKFYDVMDQVSGDLSHVIQELGKRESTELELDADDFDVLISRKEFMDLVAGELYEAYFLPDRHESDLLLLRELLAIITSEHVKQFVLLSVASGVVGNTAFAVLRAVLVRILTLMKKAEVPASRCQPFSAMKRDVDRVAAFFRKNECARLEEIETSTGIPRDRLLPLLKLLGFKHYRRQNARRWCKPGATAITSLQR